MAFSDICGHEKQIGILQKAIVNNRVPHAYLFYGMKGIGKRRTALVFAKALNCMAGKGDACGRCAPCRKADHGNHPDLILIEPSGQFIRIQEIRALQEQMTYRPFEGGKRIFIVADADKMNPTAANALLKVLEEPTPSNILILVTSRPYQLPMTILSRCQPLRFNPLTRDTLALYLETRQALPPEKARMLAASSGGSLGRAVEMSKEDYLSLRDELLDRFFIGKNRNPLLLFSLARDFGQDRQEILERLALMKICLRDALVLKETCRIDYLFNQDRAEAFQSFAAASSSETLLSHIGTVDRAWRAIDQNANKSLTLEAMLFKLTADF